ncbi:protein adenylyltransferase SelO [Teredinibacter franksiae]|uniref:protein adenylyltransferase SelO n=1 Tax=Teredinibacter franksiae TaxID=2761453 RepID=UPI001FECEAFD|nr:YdiU family protein [Teredinibacter franksiae]
MNMVLSNSYPSLGEEFYEHASPSPVSAPKLLLWNPTLANELGIPHALQNDVSALSQFFSGNQLFANTTPMALAYSGHQFGQFNPRLGDGRAHLLGEITDQQNRTFDIQLKGSGRTPFSRSGDGRCAVGPAVREFIMSEAMYALGVPTSRALAVVTTGETVFREAAMPGAVVTRVAASHLRVGTFEYFYSQGNISAIKTLCRYAANRHYPEIEKETGGRFYSAFLQAVFNKQIELVCQWMRVGFIHGVMNTDNTTISGETIDYGPCAMMNVYDQNTVFSSIDSMGRYRFGYQPNIAQWNMARLAECLLPLIDENASTAQKIAEDLLEKFSSDFKQRYLSMLGKKIGLANIDSNDEPLINELLEFLRVNALDYTQTFDALTRSVISTDSTNEVRSVLGPWFAKWQTRLSIQDNGDQTVYALMRAQNPVVIPRNHHMEAVITHCIETGKADAAEKFLQVLQSPYQDIDTTTRYQDAPEDGGRSYQTFCGT